MPVLARSTRYQNSVADEVKLAIQEEAEDIQELNAYFAWEMAECDPDDDLWDESLYDYPKEPLGDSYDPGDYDDFDYELSTRSYYVP